MFFPMFWTAYIPIAIVILHLIGDWLVQTLRQLRESASLAVANRRYPLQPADGIRFPSGFSSSHSRVRL
jgi:hypothetical protein